MLAPGSGTTSLRCRGSCGSAPKPDRSVKSSRRPTTLMGVARALQVRGVRTPAGRSTGHPVQASNRWPLGPCLGGGGTGARCPTHLCTASTVRQQRAHLWQADRLSWSVSEVGRQITIFTLAATPLACSAVMHPSIPMGNNHECSGRIACGGGQAVTL
jgi:hypothetical protein